MREKLNGLHLVVDDCCKEAFLSVDQVDGYSQDNVSARNTREEDIQTRERSYQELKGEWIEFVLNVKNEYI